MTAKTKLISFIVAVVLILAVGFALLRLNSSQSPPVRFGCLSVSTSSNTTSITVGITNYSGSTIVYLVCPPVVKSNGVWTDYQFPGGTQLEVLKEEVGTATVTMSSQSAEAKVPILWGFYWGTQSNGIIDFARRPPIQSPTVRGAEMQSLSRSADGLITGRDPNGIGALYTNYLMGIKP